MNKRGAVFFCILFCSILVLLASQVQGIGMVVRNVTLEPAHPTRVDLLTCRYTGENPGPYLFQFYRNEDRLDVLFFKETDKKTVSYRLQNVQNRDTVTCRVSRQFRDDYVPLESATVTVGAFQCNDLLDNDLDGKIDMQDPGCQMPKDNNEQEPECMDGADNDRDGLIDLQDPGCMRDPQRDSEVSENGLQCDNDIDDDQNGPADMRDPGCESPFDDEERTDYAAFCRAQADNVFCLGLGMNEIARFCSTQPNQALCRQFPDNYVEHAEQWCRQMPQHAFCTGTPDIAGRCTNMRNDLLCNEFSAVIMIGCRDEQKCFELNQEEKEAFCQLQHHPFCTEQVYVDAEAVDEQPPDQPVPPVPEEAEDDGAAEARREEIREVVEDLYRDVRDRQRRLEAREEPVQQAPEDELLEMPLEDVEEETREMEKIIFEKEKTMDKKGSVPLKGFIAATGGIIALLALVFYILFRKKSKQSVTPVVKRVRIRKKKQR